MSRILLEYAKNVIMTDIETKEKLKEVLIRPSVSSESNKDGTKSHLSETTFYVLSRYGNDKGNFMDAVIDRRTLDRIRRGELVNIRSHFTHNRDPEWGIFRALEEAIETEEK